jgi:hypothetical protein
MYNRLKHWIFNVRYVHQNIEQALSKFIGVSSFANNYINIIVLAFEECLSDLVYDHMESPLRLIKEELMEYGLDDYQVEEVYPYILINVKRMTDIVRNSFPEKTTEDIFLVNAIGDEVHIEAVKEQTSQPEDIEYLNSDKVLRDIEAGHYVPEKIRKLHGF